MINNDTEGSTVNDGLNFGTNFNLNFILLLKYNCAVMNI